MPASPRHLALSAGLGLVAATLVTLPAPAHAIGPGLVISEVYGGGNQVGGDGVTSAVLQNDFVELHNTTTGPISLLGKSLQYRAAGSVGLASSVLPLPDADLPAGGKLLVRGLGGTDRGEPLPTPDVDWNLNLNTNTGQVFIADTADAIDPNEPAGASGSTFSADVIDFLGWGGASDQLRGLATCTGKQRGELGRAHRRRHRPQRPRLHGRGSASRGLRLRGRSRRAGAPASRRSRAPAPRLRCSTTSSPPKAG